MQYVFVKTFYFVYRARDTSTDKTIRGDESTAGNDADIA